MASSAKKMGSRGLSKLTVITANNGYFCTVILINRFGVIISVSMNRPGFGNEFLLRFSPWRRQFPRGTLRAYLALEMVTRSLPKLAVIGTNNGQLSEIADVNGLGIVVSISMSRPSIGNERLNGFAPAIRANLLTASRTSETSGGM